MTEPTYADLRFRFTPTEFYLSNGRDDSMAWGTTVMACRLCGAFTDEGEHMEQHFRYHNGRGEFPA
jgi:hypothetical protein